MPIYEKPTIELMREFATERLTPGQVFNGKEAVAWFAERYPKIKGNTVSMHVEGMAVNSNRRKHVSNARAGGGFDLFYKLGPNQYRLWDRDNDPAPKYRDDFEKEDRDVGEETDVQDSEGCGPACLVVWEGKDRDRRSSPIPIAYSVPSSPPAES